MQDPGGGVGVVVDVPDSVRTVGEAADWIERHDPSPAGADPMTLQVRGITWRRSCPLAAALGENDEVLVVMGHDR